MPWLLGLLTGTRRTRVERNCQRAEPNYCGACLFPWASHAAFTRRTCWLPAAGMQGRLDWRTHRVFFFASQKFLASKYSTSGTPAVPSNLPVVTALPTCQYCHAVGHIACGRVINLDTASSSSRDDCISIPLCRLSPHRFLQPCHGGKWLKLRCRREDWWCWEDERGIDSMHLLPSLNSHPPSASSQSLHTRTGITSHEQCPLSPPYHAMPPAQSPGAQAISPLF